jgi:hypothetical protein
MTQAVLDSSDATQCRPASTAAADRDYPNFSAPALTLPLEGLEREEVASLTRAMEFLCILIEFYDKNYAEGPAFNSNGCEHAAAA